MAHINELVLWGWCSF